MKLKLLLLLLLLLLVSSCGTLRTPEERAKRKVKKILERFPEISNQEERSSRDTLVRLDSFLTKSVSIDTIFNFNSDTVFLVTEGGVSTEVQIYNRERVRVKTLVRADTFYFRDTLIREHTIIREIIKPLEPSFFDKYGILLILSSVLVVGYGLYRFL